MTAYYNEIDTFAAAWLRELIKAGQIAPGDVDERSIIHVQAADLVGYDQVHLFAGIGGWSLAARLAGIPDDFPLWTGSAPCQPFSYSGKQRGTDDERHLWPVMRALVAECRPPVVAGEQVASRLGFDWLAAVRADLEAEGYAVGAVDLCAAGVGAPHIRQRLYWGGVADFLELGEGRDTRALERTTPTKTIAGDRSPSVAGYRRAARELADAGRERGAFGLPAQGYGQGGNAEEPWHGGGGCGRRALSPSDARPSPPDLGWADTDWLFCRDGRWRPVRSGTFPLAYGVPARVGRLRGYGNAIVPQVAAAFLRALLDAA